MITQEMIDAGWTAWAEAWKPLTIAGIEGADEDRKHLARAFDSIRSMQAMRWPEHKEHHESFFNALRAFYEAADSLEPKSQDAEIINMAMAANHR